ncbi:CBS domain-containing protein [Candidatus Bathyarchaeota archaeon]|nr:CBS domain-containing protein [Candidatus Bathyarchaeota archaeon]
MNNMLAKDVMLKRIYTIQPNKRVALARLRMLRHSIGALPVVNNDNTLVGIITLRDIDLAGDRTYELTVDDLMTNNLITRRENTPLNEIAEIMIQTGLERIPITNKDDKLIGLITQSVVIKATKKLLD